MQYKEALPYASFVNGKPEQVSEMQVVSKPTINNWIDRWRRGGVEGLANRPKSGRPLMMDDRYSLALLEVIEKEPSELGYDFSAPASAVLSLLKQRVMVFWLSTYCSHLKPIKDIFIFFRKTRKSVDNGFANRICFLGSLSPIKYHYDG